MYFSKAMYRQQQTPIVCQGKGIAANQVRLWVMYDCADAWPVNMYSSLAKVPYGLILPTENPDWLPKGKVGSRNLVDRIQPSGLVFHIHGLEGLI